METSTSGLVDVGGVDDFESRPTAVVAAGRELIVYRWGDRFVAVRNRCPHQNLPFTGGAVFCRVRGTTSQSEMVPAADEPVLVCPAHRYEFDAEGKCVTQQHGAKQLRIKAYPVRVVDGRVVVDMRSKKMIQEDRDAS
ncbi:MAG TPA: Rieske (2Fe-2S) protein [Solirubrobacteraceae bacterium]|nr:Rieske (2Fe-2S) protein [Solirubrobacteraceae bacterium]